MAIELPSYKCYYGERSTKQWKLPHTICCIFLLLIFQWNRFGLIEIMNINYKLYYFQANIFLCQVKLTALYCRWVRKVLYKMLLNSFSDKFDQFWSVNRKLMEHTDDQLFKHIPFRIYQVSVVKKTSCSIYLSMSMNE